MIRRLYVHNFRCLENFELKLDGMPSVLLIGKNGSGKSAVGQALEIFQKIARGTNHVRGLANAKDFTLRRTDAPMRFEIEVALDSDVYRYSLALKFHEEGGELQVLEELFAVNGMPAFVRDDDQISLPTNGGLGGGSFSVDPHLVALPIIQVRWMRDPLFFFKNLLARMQILSPIPTLIKGDSTEGTLWAEREVSNFGAWFSELLAQVPSAYSKINEHLKQVMPDFKDIKNPQFGMEARNLVVQFSKEGASFSLPFGELSDGEKCFIICAVLLAESEAYHPLLCFWDEPDNYLALDEVQHFIIALRSEFHKSGGQFIATSHNPEVIRAFSDETTLVLQRKNHLEPTVVRKLGDLHVHGDLVDAITRGDLGE